MESSEIYLGPFKKEALLKKEDYSIVFDRIIEKWKKDLAIYINSENFKEIKGLMELKFTMELTTCGRKRKK